MTTPIPNNQEADAHTDNRKCCEDDNEDDQPETMEERSNNSLAQSLYTKLYAHAERAKVQTACGETTLPQQGPVVILLACPDPGVRAAHFLCNEVCTLSHGDIGSAAQGIHSTHAEVIRRIWHQVVYRLGCGIGINIADGLPVVRGIMSV